ncbi:hypothetical protein THRCLA_10914 [Thraustotheca clavata]|uniref:Polygalacturonase n=1 Tax=Thraustotheca clavata TaxID=74557 RepID=A0A1V9YDC3_9STRA|nr:hypothetical protein THRCLA_10914 [Thraustotheca clavata]
MNGIRIKTVSGAKGTVSNIKYSGITLNNISQYDIAIQQGSKACQVEVHGFLDYLNSGPTGIPTEGFPITQVTLDTISGSVAANAIEKYILCAEGACSDWSWSGVSICGGKHSL